MSEINGKYTTIKLFTWVIGVMVTLLIFSFGYISARTSENENRTQSNEIMLGRMDERLNNISTSLIEIKELLKKQ